MSKYSALLFSAILIFIGWGCLVVGDKFSGIPPGQWRAVLKLEPSMIVPNPRGEPLPEKLNLEFEEVSNGELPFTFEVIYEDEKKFYIEIKNAGERFRVDDIILARDRSTAKDTILIRFPSSDSYIRGIFEESIIEGEWMPEGSDEPGIPFVAWHGQDHRFTRLRKPAALDVTGEWNVNFEADPENDPPAKCEFHQEGNYLEGAFTTELENFLYLEGTIQANKLYLSSFDGRRAILIEGRIQADGSLIGSFRSGKQYRSTWTATKKAGLGGSEENTEK